MAPAAYCGVVLFSRSLGGRHSMQGAAVILNRQSAAVQGKTAAAETQTRSEPIGNALGQQPG